MRRRGDRRAALLPILAASFVAALLFGGPAASAALPGFSWPVQSQGNRGADVRAIQSLLRGQAVRVPYDGVFGTETRTAVLALQRARGLPPTGIVDAPTWAALAVPVRAGAPREAVLTLQRQLNEKRGAGLGVTGVYDASTRAAVRAFERHVGLPIDGVVDRKAWRFLVAHFDLPRFGAASGLCDYSVGNGPANWGTGAAIGQLEAAGAAASAAGLGRLAVGDVSREHPGDIAGHSTHEVGLDVDLRPIRKDRAQCRWGTNVRLASYDRAATRSLVRLIRRTAPGHVKLVYFNDPVLVREGLTTRYPGHDDHLHVRYCEAGHAQAAYRCPP